MFVDEEAIMPRSLLVKKTNYSHCPLKKRPVQIVKDETPEEVEKAMAVDNSEPENLSTKPEDLSLTAAHTSKALCPSARPYSGVSIVPKRVVKSERQESTSPLTSASPLIHHPLVPSHYLGKTGGPLEPLNLNTPVDPHHHYASTTSSWHRPTPSNHYPASHYLAAFNYAYPPAAEIFHHHQYASSLYPASPVRTAPLLSHPLAHHHEQLSPYAPRESAHSPPHMPTLRAPVAVVAALPHRHPHSADIPKLYMPYQDHCGLSPTSSIASSSSRGAFHSLSPPPATPEDLSSPGSVSSGSSSAGSVGVGVSKKRAKDAGVPRYQCMDCSKSYSTYSGLSKHQQFHCVATAGSQAKKSFSCKYCEKVYVSLGALKMHIRTHTLPCKCKLCGKAFSRPWLLQGHIRTHTGEKPFSCQHCNRAFADRSNLRAHLQTHSDVKKYSCVTCSKTFSRMSLLTKHMDGGCPGTGGSPHMMHMDMGSHHHISHQDSGDEGHNIMYPSP